MTCTLPEGEGSKTANPKRKWRLLRLTSRTSSAFRQISVCRGGERVTKLGLSDDEPQRLVFIGATGSGKSSLCTALTTSEKAKQNSQFKLGDGADSETTKSKVQELHWLGVPEKPTFKCIDTPGLNDSDGRDEEHIRNIVAKVRSPPLCRSPRLR